MPEDDLDEEHDYDLMLAYANYESVEHSWQMTSVEHKLKFIAIAQKLRRDDQRVIVDDEKDEHDDMIAEAKELCHKYHGDPSRSVTDDDIVAFKPDRKPQVNRPPVTSAPASAAPPRRFGR